MQLWSKHVSDVGDPLFSICFNLVMEATNGNSNPKYVIVKCKKLIELCNNKMRKQENWKWFGTQ